MRGGLGIRQEERAEVSGRRFCTNFEGVFPNSSRQIHGSMNLTTAEIETTSTEPLT